MLIFWIIYKNLFIFNDWKRYKYGLFDRTSSLWKQTFKPKRYFQKKSSEKSTYISTMTCAVLLTTLLYVGVISMTSATPLVGVSNTGLCTLQNVVWSNIKARPDNNLFDKIDNFMDAFVSTSKEQKWKLSYLLKFYLQVILLALSSFVSTCFQHYKQPIRTHTTKWLPYILLYKMASKTSKISRL